MIGCRLSYEHKKKALRIRMDGVSLFFICLLLLLFFKYSAFLTQLADLSLRMDSSGIRTYIKRVYALFASLASRGNWQKFTKSSRQETKENRTTINKSESKANSVEWLIFFYFIFFFSCIGFLNCCFATIIPNNILRIRFEKDVSGTALLALSPIGSWFWFLKQSLSLFFFSFS